jgi:hypothetical protein
MYNRLTLVPIKIKVASLVLSTLGVFGSLALIKDVAMGLLSVEVSFFLHISIPLKVFSPLKWWQNMKSNFLILDSMHVRLWGL